MPTYTDEEIIVVFDPFEKHDKIDLEAFKFCAVCKQMRELGQYKSLYRRRGNNKICRLCLNKSAKLKDIWTIKSNIKKSIDNIQK